MKAKLAVILAIALVATPFTAWTQDLDKGISAAIAGDYEAALRELRPLAQQGIDDAQFNLGVMYRNGYGVPQDHAEATRWYRMAAEQGHGRAQYNMGIAYDNGNGAPKDHTEAARWYRLAAEQGHANAQFNLGVMYGNGYGVPQDRAKAHMWFNLANANGTTEEGRKSLEKIESGMTASEILEAQKRARNCFDSGYKDCGG